MVSKLSATSRNQRVIDVLTEFGPMTAHDIAEELGLTQKEVSLSINSMRRDRINGRRVHIHSYVRTWEGIQPRPRAVWAVGQGEDARFPKRIHPNEACRRWRVKQQLRVPSVFAWGRSMR